MSEPTAESDAASEEARRRFLTEPVVRARRAPVNGMPRGTISWSEHEKAWEAYHRRHSGQSAERIAERGGFGIEELTYQLGHLPPTWEPGVEALRQMEYFGVQPTRVTPPAECRCVVGICSEDGECCESHDCPPAEPPTSDPSPGGSDA